MRIVLKSVVGSLNHTAALRILWVLVLGWTAVVGRLVVMRHEKFGTFDYDLGIYDQTIWLLSRGQSFITVRGMDAFGHHATFSFYLLSPMSWLGGGPNTWNILHCLALASCAIPLYLLARNRSASPWQSLAIGSAWLLQPWLSWLAQETFHPEVMAMPFLLTAFLLVDPAVDRDVDGGLSSADRQALVLVVIAMAWKEDVSLAVAMMGVAVLILGRRRMGLLLSGIGLLWFAFFAIWLVPKLAGGRPSYGGLYGDLGESGAQIIMNVIRNPTKFLDRLVENNAPLYALRLILPFGMLALASPLILIMLPQFFANIISANEWTYQPRYHYSAMPMVALALATVDGMFRLARARRLARFGVVPFVAILLVTSVGGARMWGILPLGERYRQGAWPLAESDTTGWIAAIARVGPTDGVAAHYLAVPHLTRRSHVYTFPNPWENSYFGTSSEDRGDPRTVDWLIVWPEGTGDSARIVLERLLGSGEFGDPEEINGVVSYRRLRAHSD